MVAEARDIVKVRTVMNMVRGEATAKASGLTMKVATKEAMNMSVRGTTLGRKTNDVMVVMMATRMKDTDIDMKMIAMVVKMKMMSMKAVDTTATITIITTTIITGLMITKKNIR